MSYDAFEESTEDGQPIEFYSFVIGSTTFRFTNGPKAVMTPDGFIWKPAPISTDGIRQSGEAVSDAMQIIMPSGLSPAQIYVNSPPSTAMVVRVLKKQVADNEIKIKYIGTVSQCDFSSPGQATLTCETLSASMSRQGLRLPWQKTCPYALYDPVTCGVDMNAYAVPLRVLAIDEFDVQTDSAGAHPDGYFAGGFVAWDGGPRGMEYRTIESHTGFFIQMFGVTNDLYVGQQVTAYPGCQRTVAACQAFDNLPRYGGIPSLPGRSPFDGTPIFY